jgi:hypothetical protein
LKTADAKTRITRQPNRPSETNPYEGKQINETNAGTILDEYIQRETDEVNARYQKPIEDLESQKDEHTAKEIEYMKIALKQAKQRKKRELAEKRKTLKKKDGGGILFGLGGLRRKLSEADDHPPGESPASSDPIPVPPMTMGDSRLTGASSRPATPTPNLSSYSQASAQLPSSGQGYSPAPPVPAKSSSRSTQQQIQYTRQTHQYQQSFGQQQQRTSSTDLAGAPSTNRSSKSTMNRSQY